MHSGCSLYLFPYSLVHGRIILWPDLVHLGELSCLKLKLMSEICSRSGIMVRQVFTLLRLEQRGEDKIKKVASGKGCRLEKFRFRSEQSSLAVFFRWTEREDNHVFMWNKSTDWALITHVIKLQHPTRFILSSSQKEIHIYTKKKYTNDRWTTKKSHLQ